jgi:hypothetical protein
VKLCVGGDKDAQDAVAKVQDPYAIELIMDALRKARRGVEREYTIPNTLAKIGTRVVEPLIRALSANEFYSAKLEIIEVLGKVRDKRA